jgi:uncharacterized protein YbjT (DUF2867 family)
MNNLHNEKDLTLVLGGTGKTGRRVAERMTAKGQRPRRIAICGPVLRLEQRGRLGRLSRGCDRGVHQLCAGPGDARGNGRDPGLRGTGQTSRRQARGPVVGSWRRGAQACERIVQESGLLWTIVRASWFNQNFSEGAFIDMVLGGAITLPAGDQVEPFVDVDDIADVVVAALTEDHHDGQIYEVTGPRLMSIADVAADLSRVVGREIAYVDVPHDAFVSEVASSGAPDDVVWMLDYLFATVLDGRNAI